MAVVTTPLDSTLIARYQTGTSASGSPVIRQKSFTGIKSTASDQDVYDIAEAFFGLLAYPLVEVRRSNQDSLVDQ